MYSARITRHTPAAFLFLIDQSGSMEEKMIFGSQVTTKAEVVATVTNMILREIVDRCRREDGIADYFDIAVIGYSGDEATMLIGTRNSFAKPSHLAMADCRRRRVTRERILPDGTSAMVNDEIPCWVEPHAEGDTPMRSVLERACMMAGQWCEKPANRNSYPPTIINITDGEATDGDSEELKAIAARIRSLGTEDGPALLMNINVSSSFCDHTILFPCSCGELPGCRYSETLFEMSSVMPETYNESITEIKPDSRPPFRAMSLNTSAADLIAMMNIGSLSVNRML